jgi:hypothetical protein
MVPGHQGALVILPIYIYMYMENSELATRLAVHTHPTIKSPYRSFSTLHLN